jgi:adenosylmethionine-8-amino-7-oxononanoate aminotransferase
VEGIGGLSVPIYKDYLVADLIKELNAPLVIVSPNKLGTINHTLLTVNKARELGLEILGLIFNNPTKIKKDISQKTNPRIIKELSGVDILGELPYERKISDLAKSAERNLDLNLMLRKLKSKKLWQDSKELAEWDKKYIWHPFTQMKDWQNEEPLIIQEAKGCYLKDVKGRWFLDGVSSLWVNIHGHRKKEVDEAIKKQLNKVAHSTLLGLAGVPSIKLAKELVKIAPKGLNRVFYSDNGSTSVEVALKMAFQYWQHKGAKEKTRFVYLENSYHGDTLGSVSVGGIDLFHKVFHPLLFSSFKADSPYCYRCPKNKIYPKCRFECLKKLESILKNNHKTIAALIVEPIVQCAGGMIVWPKGILRRMRKLANDYDVLLISDEVAVGFGRTGRMFACEHEKVSPDIMCLSKGLSAGYLPLAVTLTSDKIYDAFLGDYAAQKTFFHGHSYTGNALACAAALASLELFRKEKIIQRLGPKIKFLENELKKFKQLKHVGDVRQKGLIAAVELVQDKKTREPYPWQEKVGVKVCLRARDYGIILRPLGNVIVLMPPLAISKDELKLLLSAASKAIKQVTEA